METSKLWPNSSQVLKTEYSIETKELDITFRGYILYRYFEVPEEVWGKLLKADSIGRFVNSDIKPKYRYKKL